MFLRKNSIHRIPEIASFRAIVVLAGAAACFLASASLHAGPCSANQTMQDLMDRQSRNIVIAAHRGGHQHDWEYRAPENSLANLEKAVELEFEIYETDIHRSKDGVFVVMHDPTVDRTTNGTGRVEDLYATDLQNLRLRYQNGHLADETVPTFEELLRRGRDRIVFKVDYKASLAHFPEVVKLVDAVGTLDQVIFRFWFNAENAARLQDFIAQGMPYTSTLLMFRTKSIQEIDDVIEEFDVSLIEVSMTSEELTEERRDAIRHARDSGLVVETHALGGPVEWGALISAGIRIFHSKEPEQMKRYLRSRNLDSCRNGSASLIRESRDAH